MSLVSASGRFAPILFYVSGAFLAIHPTSKKPIASKVSLPKDFIAFFFLFCNGYKVNGYCLHVKCPQPLKESFCLSSLLFPQLLNRMWDVEDAA